MAVPIPSSLVRHLRDGRCALFAGAGLSAAAGLPDWKSLLWVMIEEIEAEEAASGPGQELRKLVDAGKLLEVADHCRECLGARRYFELLGDRLRGGAGELPEVHRLITELPFSAVVTTNYDKLLERAYTRFRGDLPKVVTGRDRQNLGSLLFSGGFFILKAHGDIDDAASLVLTTRDYRDTIHANPAFNALFSALLMTRSILFIGYSLSDPDFRLLLEGQLCAFGENIPERYAVMSGVGPIESDVLKRAANIKVLPYPEGQHGELPSFLRTLEERVRAAPGPAASMTAPEPLLGKRNHRAQHETAAVIFSNIGSTPAASSPSAPVPATKTDPSHAASGSLMPVERDIAELTLVLRDGQLEASLRTARQHIVHVTEAATWSLFSKTLPGLVQSFSRERGAGAMRKLGIRLASLLPSSSIAELGSDALMLRTSRDLADIPWEVAVCSGEEPLALARPVCRALFAGTAAARGLPGVRQPARVLIIGDPGRVPEVRLEGAHREAIDVAAAYRGAASTGTCTLLCREHASLDAVVDALTGTHYDIVHFAGHAWFDGQESYLAFDENDHITASELRTLIGPNPPAILILNSHYTAFIPRGIRPGSSHASELPNRLPPL